MERLYRYYHSCIAVDGKAALSTLLVARDKREAKKRYKECVLRNGIPQEVLKRDPNICELVGATQLIDDQFTDEMKAELEKYNSVLETYTPAIL